MPRPWHVGQSAMTSDEFTSWTLLGPSDETSARMRPSRESHCLVVPAGLLRELSAQEPRGVGPFCRHFEQHVNGTLADAWPRLTLPKTRISHMRSTTARLGGEARS